VSKPFIDRINLQREEVLKQRVSLFIPCMDYEDIAQAEVSIKKGNYYLRWTTDFSVEEFVGKVEKTWQKLEKEPEKKINRDSCLSFSKFSKSLKIFSLLG